MTDLGVLFDIARSSSDDPSIGKSCRKAIYPGFPFWIPDARQYTPNRHPLILRLGIVRLGISVVVQFGDFYGIYKLGDAPKAGTADHRFCGPRLFGPVMPADGWAARLIGERALNFDIYLPIRLGVRKQYFGILFATKGLFVLWRWVV